MTFVTVYETLKVPELSEPAILKSQCSGSRIQNQFPLNNDFYCAMSQIFQTPIGHFEHLAAGFKMSMLLSLYCQIESLSLEILPMLQPSFQTLISR